jgi:hypothetical protein
MTFEGEVPRYRTQVLVNAVTVHVEWARSSMSGTLTCQGPELSVGGVNDLKSESCGRCPGLDSEVRRFSEVPNLVVYAHQCNVIAGKRNFFESPDLDNAALTCYNLNDRPSLSSTETT